jgi:hypothetical protein
MREPVTVACAQLEPVVLDRDATIEKLAGSAAEVASKGAQLAVFPEAFVPHLPPSKAPPAGPTTAPRSSLFARGGRDPRPPSGGWADRTSQPGCHHDERDQRGRGRLQPLLCTTTEGTAEHRKLVLTNHERLSGARRRRGLETIDTPLVHRGLICWENYMPLARFAPTSPVEPTSPRPPTMAMPGSPPSIACESARS